MNYISTRGGVEPVGFRDAVMMGMASDGGLLLPESIPEVSDRLAEWQALSYTDLAVRIMELYVDLPRDDLAALVAGGDVIKDKLVGPLLVVANRAFRHVARVDMVEESYPLDNPTVINVQTGDDPLG